MTRVFYLTGIIALFCISSVFAQDAKEIIKKADEKFQGEKSSQGEMDIIIKRPKWERTFSVKSWSLGKDFSLTLITSPANEKGQTFLKRYNELWSWNPSISRMLKLPPSMMSQGWMGSDYSNDDILRESSIANDYDAKLLGEEKCQGYDCYKIQLIPHEDVAVVWGKIIIWISKNDYFQLKGEYYDEDDYLVRTMLASDIKTFDDRELPSKLVLIPAEEEGNSTTVILKNFKFNQNIEESFFSQQNMKKVR
ncbi:MAG: outer membrane lipoprotein-sorting protein [Bacteroidales bacterium]|nr:outer membrane lipoprotein-sorting protein [Bacteroidales bacterium]